MENEEPHFFFGCFFFCFTLAPSATQATIQLNTRHAMCNLLPELDIIIHCEREKVECMCLCMQFLWTVHFSIYYLRDSTSLYSFTHSRHSRPLTLCIQAFHLHLGRNAFYLTMLPLLPTTAAAAGAAATCSFVYK